MEGLGGFIPHIINVIPPMKCESTNELMVLWLIPSKKAIDLMGTVLQSLTIVMQFPSFKDWKPYFSLACQDFSIFNHENFFMMGFLTFFGVASARTFLSSLRTMLESLFLTILPPADININRDPPLFISKYGNTNIHIQSSLLGWPRTCPGTP